MQYAVVLKVLSLLCLLDRICCASKDEGKDALNNIKKEYDEKHTDTIDISDDVNSIITFLDSPNITSYQENELSKFLMDMNTALPQMQSSNNGILTVNVLRIVEKLGSLVPVVGDFIGAFINIIIQVLTGVAQKSQAEILGEVVDQALYRDDERGDKATANGIKDLFNQDLNYVKLLLSASTVTADEMSNLGVSDKLAQGVVFQGSIATKAKQYAGINGQHDRAMTYLNLYTQLTTLQDIYRWGLYGVAKKANLSDTKYITQIESSFYTGVQNDRNNLLWLNQPTMNKAVFFSSINLFADQWKPLQTLTRNRDIFYQDLTSLNGKYYSLTSKSRPGYVITVVFKEGSGASGTLGYKDDYYSVDKTKERYYANHFQFVKSGNDNVFILKSRKWPSLFFEQHGTSASTTNQIRAESKLKIVRLNTNYYLISSLNRPNGYLYMSTGWWDTPIKFSTNGELYGDEPFWTFNDRSNAISVFEYVTMVAQLQQAEFAKPANERNIPALVAKINDLASRLYR